MFVAELALLTAMSDSGRILTSRHKQTDFPKPDWILTGVIIDWPDGMPAALSQTAWVETPHGWT
jgi:hypothetical protein